MGKSVYIAEKPSVAQEFAKALHTINILIRLPMVRL